MAETLGRRLAEARESLGLSLEDVARQTRIHRDTIAHIEDDDDACFAHPIYAKNFIKMYAKFLRLDIREEIGDLERACEPRYDGAGQVLPGPEVGRYYRREWPGRRARVLPLVLVAAVLLFLSFSIKLMIDLPRLRVREAGTVAGPERLAEPAAATGAGQALADGSPGTGAASEMPAAASLIEEAIAKSAPRVPGSLPVAGAAPAPASAAQQGAPAPAPVPVAVAVPASVSGPRVGGAQATAVPGPITQAPAPGGGVGAQRTTGATDVQAPRVPPEIRRAVPVPPGGAGRPSSPKTAEVVEASRRT